MQQQQQRQPKRGKAEVTLGRHTYTVVPQKPGRLLRRLSPEALSALLGGDTSEFKAGFQDSTRSKVYDLLEVFIPKNPPGERKGLMPKHEFLGYRSEGEMLAGEYDEDNDTEPDIDQVAQAIEAGLDVNHFDKAKILGNLLGPEVVTHIRAIVRVKLAEASERLLIESASSQPQNGASHPESSGTTPPTSTESTSREGSLSPA